jgi:hypothetical protein
MEKKTADLFVVAGSEVHQDTWVTDRYEPRVTGGPFGTTETFVDRLERAELATALEEWRMRGVLDRSEESVRKRIATKLARVEGDHSPYRALEKVTEAATGTDVAADTCVDCSARSDLCFFS